MCPQKLKKFRALLLKFLKLCMDPKIIYAKFQGNRLVNEIAQALQNL